MIIQQMTLKPTFSALFAERVELGMMMKMRHCGEREITNGFEQSKDDQGTRTRTIYDKTCFNKTSTRSIFFREIILSGTQIKQRITVQRR